MKNLMIAIALLMGTVVFSAQNAQAANLTKAQYECIALQLEMINSDIYYGLDEATIDSMLTIPEYFGHVDAINAAARCEVR